LSSETPSIPETTASALTGLAAASEVERLRNAPGWYTADLCDDWNFMTPSGGVLMSIALRAMQAELDDPELRPLSATTLFMSPVPAGPMEIRVELLRRGGVAAQLRAELSSTTLPGPGLEVSATFARRLANGPSFTDAIFPDVPLPEDVPPEAPMERPAFFDNLEIVQVEGPTVFSEAGWEPSNALVTRWYRYRVPQFDDAGRFDRMALPPIIDNMPPAAFARIGSEGPPLHAPSLDLTVHFLDDCADEWLLLRHRAKKAHGGFGTADVEVWSRGGRLVAVGTQMMIFRSMPADPPTGFRRSSGTS